MNHESRIMVFIAMILALLFLIHPAYAQENIGTARINPSSPLYFLKSIREILELKFAGTTEIRALRQLEFSIRRIREVNSLAGGKTEELIEPTLEKYAWHLNELAGIVNPSDIEMVSKVNEEVDLQFDSLKKTFEHISDQRAKRSIRLAIFRITEWNQKMAERFDPSKQASLREIFIKSKLAGCIFLSHEASSSALNQVERLVYQERTAKCLTANL